MNESAIRKMKVFMLLNIAVSMSLLPIIWLTDIILEPIWIIDTVFDISSYALLFSLPIIFALWALDTAMELLSNK
jgi:uncharacterized membrane protein YqjE